MNVYLMYSLVCGIWDNKFYINIIIKFIYKKIYLLIWFFNVLSCYLFNMVGKMKFGDLGINKIWCISCLNIKYLCLYKCMRY